MKFKLIFALLAFCSAACAQVFSNRTYTIDFNPTGNIALVTFSNRFFEGVCTIESREGPKWIPVKNFFTTQRVGQVTLTLPTNTYTLLRLRCLSVAPGNAFVNLAKSCGNIETVAGGAPRPDGPSTWLPEWEGTNATSVYLSDPCCAVADEAGNIYVAERSGHAVDKITPDGRIFTWIGTHQPGGSMADDGGAYGPFSAINTPSGLHIAGNKLFVLDGGNDRVRVVDVDDTLINVRLVFRDLELGIGTNAHGLWVGLNSFGTPNEALYGVGGELRIWEKNTVTNLAAGFGQVGWVTVNPRGRIIVTDPPNHRVYRVISNGHWGEDTVIAGTGFARGNTGDDADEVALPGARSVAYLPIGGFFIGLDDGARVWYVDSDDNAAPFIFGKPGTHEGDGKWFRAGGRKPKISNVQSVAVAPNGDIILVEGGVVRRIKFLRHRP